MYIYIYIYIYIYNIYIQSRQDWGPSGVLQSPKLLGLLPTPHLMGLQRLPWPCAIFTS